VARFSFEYSGGGRVPRRRQHARCGAIVTKKLSGVETRRQRVRPDGNRVWATPVHPRRNKDDGHKCHRRSVRANEYFIGNFSRRLNDVCLRESVDSVKCAGAKKKTACRAKIRDGGQPCPLTNTAVGHCRPLHALVLYFYSSTESANRYHTRIVCVRDVRARLR